MYRSIDIPCIIYSFYFGKRLNLSFLRWKAGSISHLQFLNILPINQLPFMYPEDRVLVAFMARPADFATVQQYGWYRIPQRHAPKGLHAEYYAFYFGRHFGAQKWSVVYYAPRLGYELTTRLALLPEEPAHPRAQELYYQVQLGSLQALAQPIISLHWRRITFIHTTGDRFQDAREINDLFVEGGGYVDRRYATLKDQEHHPQRQYTVQEGRGSYMQYLSKLSRRNLP